MTKTDDIYSRPVPICPVRGSVVYPTMVMPIDASRPISIRAINTALDQNKVIVIVSQKDREIQTPSPKDLFKVGTACNILRMKKSPDNSVKMMVQAFARVQIKQYSPDEKDGILYADILPFHSNEGDKVILEASFRELREKIFQYD